MNYLNVFEKNDMNETLAVEKEAELQRQRFVTDFPMESMQNLSLDDYLIAKIGYGNPNSFCFRMSNDLKLLSSMGNVRNDVFGIYLKEGTQLTLSKTYQKIYGNDYDAAFDAIKADIIDLLEAVKHKDYKIVDLSRINSAFKFKLLMVYFPDIFIPVGTKDTLNAYCKCVGLDFDSKATMIQKNLALVELKERIRPKWSNFVMMRFCDWLWRNNYIFTPDDNSQSIEIAEELEKEASNLQGLEKEAFVKQRVNQGVFRDILLKKQKKCCLCGVAEPNLLTASHIKPWRDCTPEERLDEDNGLLLCPNHDRLFDQGWISFKDNGEILISNKLTQPNRMFTNVQDKMKIDMSSDSRRVFMEYHRSKIFKT